MHYAQRRSPGSNAIGIGAVVLLHLGVGYALLLALGTDYTLTVKQPTPIVVKEEPKKIVEDPTPLLQKVELPKLETFRPKIDITIENPPVAKPFADLTDKAPPTRDLVMPTPPASAVPETAAGAKRISGPTLTYPPRQLANGQQGWVDVQCDVDETGRPSQCGMIDHEGSNAFVDDALIFVNGSRYTPATRNGAPVSEPHHRFHIEFKLAN
ncbi:MAG: TonB family protein [Aliidongia sp.]